MKTIDKKAFEKAIKENKSCSKGLIGIGRTRNSDSGKVHFNVMLNPNGELIINREGVYDSNRYEVFSGKVNSIDELESIANKKLGLN